LRDPFNWCVIHDSALAVVAFEVDFEVDFGDGFEVAIEAETLTSIRPIAICSRLTPRLGISVKLSNLGR